MDGLMVKDHRPGSSLVTVWEPELATWIPKVLFLIFSVVISEFCLSRVVTNKTLPLFPFSIITFLSSGVSSLRYLTWSQRPSCN